MKTGIIKKAAAASVAACVLLSMGGCITSNLETSVSLVYNIENGDSIKVTVDTSEGYMLNDQGDGNFSISYGSDEVATGSFKLGDDESWGILIDDLNSWGAELLDGSVEKGLFVAYIPSYNQYDYVEYVQGSETAVVMVAYSETDIYDAINVTSFSAE